MRRRVHKNGSAEHFPSHCKLSFRRIQFQADLPFVLLTCLINKKICSVRLHRHMQRRGFEILPFELCGTTTQVWLVMEHAAANIFASWPSSRTEALGQP